MNARLVLLRALNFARRQYLPLYLGTRWLAESLAVEFRDEWVTQMIERKGLTRRSQAYWKYSVFKELSQGQPVYRQCIASSATSHLSECWLISRLSELASFRRHPGQFSYIWPKHGDATHLFAHFLSGYRWRERLINDALERVTNGIAVVMDLRQFYPTVNAEVAQRRFIALLRASDLSDAERRSAEMMAEDLFSIPNVSGLPIGPPLSHVLANVVLRQVDDEMWKRYPRCYFRYVDDVVIVVPRGNRNQAIELFRSHVSRLELALNESKTDVLEASAWHERQSATEVQLLSRMCQGLMRRIELYLYQNPDYIDETRTAFRNEGFTLPFGHLRAAAADRDQQSRLKKAGSGCELC